MTIETDEEFERIVRERFGRRPYESWTDEMYEELIGQLVATQREIRAASAEPSRSRWDAETPEERDRATAEWAIWAIVTHDVGATPTHWHRIWSAVRNVISSTRYDERRRIGKAPR